MTRPNLDLRERSVPPWATPVPQHTIDELTGRREHLYARDCIRFIRPTGLDRRLHADAPLGEPIGFGVLKGPASRGGTAAPTRPGHHSDDEQRQQPPCPADPGSTRRHRVVEVRPQQFITSSKHVDGGHRLVLH